MSVLIRQADEDDRNTELPAIESSDQTNHIEDTKENRRNSTPEEAISLNISIADEIKKLAELRDEGILTSEEFENQKKKLLIYG
ncbi:SHOCT domain-containing protein [Paenibacillus mucilaginosus]|nr:SHOCT domain-containing protein [Paenibacillus mucilaginosus]